MKIINNTLYIEMPDFVEAGYTATNIYSYVSKGYSTLPFIKENGNLLFPYNEKLGKAYKEAIERKFGNPYEYAITEPIKQQITYNRDAEIYYLNAGIALEQAQNLTKAASLLDLIVKLYDNKKALKKLFGSLDNFHKHIEKIITIENIALPTSYKRLISSNESALKRYKEQSYAALVHGNTGKSNAAKIDDEVSANALKKLIEHPNQYDDVFVCYLYNKWANENGYKEIKARTVTAKRNDWKHEITPAREGWDKFNARYIRQVKGLAASTMQPLALVECDDYNLNYYYQNNDITKNSEKYMSRYVSYIVADSSCGLVLGASYRQAKAPVFDMVQVAWIDAMYYIRSLVNDGNWYLPYEVKGDHWQRDKVFPFLKKIGKLIPPALQNKQGRGYIEQLFGSPHAQRAEKMAAHKELNYNGYNITAKNRGVNVEVLKQNEKSRPFVGNEAEEQISKYLHYMRCMPSITRNNMEAQSREAMWLERWHSMTDEYKRPITDLQFLLIFGIIHKPQGRQITITNRGIEPQIGGIKYSYDLPDYLKQMHLIGTKVNVVYDPYDMSRVLVTDFDKIYFVAKHATLQPRALAYQYNGSRAALNMILEEKKAQVNNIAELAESRNINVDAEDLMMLPFMNKSEKANIETLAEQALLNYDGPAEFDINETIFNR